MAKKAAAPAAAAKPKKSPSKTEIFAAISESTGLSKKDVAAVFDALVEEIRKALGPRGPKQFTLPGLCKIYIKRQPATKAREGRNPRTGETMMIAAKPASDVLKVRALKGLKELAG